MDAASVLFWLGTCSQIFRRTRRGNLPEAETLEGVLRTPLPGTGIRTDPSLASESLGDLFWLIRRDRRGNLPEAETLEGVRRTRLSGLIGLVGVTGMFKLISEGDLPVLVLNREQSTGILEHLVGLENSLASSILFWLGTCSQIFRRTRRGNLPEAETLEGVLRTPLPGLIG